MKNLVCESLKEYIEVSLNESLLEGEHKHNPKAHLRNRGDVIFPAESSKVKDDKDHFPYNSIAQSRNALARANQYTSVPSWYNGSLKELVTRVANAVKKKYPSIEVTEASKHPDKG
jgi:hypothetical protein